MGLSRIRIGDYITPHKEICNIPNLTCWDVSGVNKEKEFFLPSQQVGKNTSKYKVVPPNFFACNLMHVGRDCALPIAMNTTNENKIVSPAYAVFKLNDENVLLRKFLFILISSREKDRYFWFHCDSSVRDGMEWKSFCDLEFDIPDIPTQQKYVDVYDAMCANQKAYEKGLDDLKLTCDAYIEELRRKMPCEKIGSYILQSEMKNESGKLTLDDVKGISIQKKFIETKADMTGVSLKPYLQVSHDSFAYVPVTSRNGDKITIALNSTNDTYLVSSSYIVFRPKDDSKLDSGYLMLFFVRSEFDRYARFNSWGSARETFDWNALCDYKIPIPDITTQKSVAEIYKAFNIRKKINEKLKQQIKNICPILIKGAIEEGKSKRG